MAKTKIFVIQLKEIIYTAIFAALGVLLILLLISMFTGKKDPQTTSDNNLYQPGLWTSTIKLSDTYLELEVVLDKNHIKSVQLVNIDEAVTTMFPLVKPSLEAIAIQLYNDVPLSEVKLLEDNSYTQTFLINAIQKVLDKAAVNSD